ncbi:two-component system, NtrC family, sensor kinase [Candidatus Magnetomoraceae bacterium gMMP-15]
MNTLKKNILSDFRKDTVLVVDDNPINLEIIVNCLEESGFKASIASNGETALKRAEHLHPDIILLDIMMPGIDGFETCRRLKANEITRDIPVIFMTALIETENKVKGFAIGAVDYITKPMQQEEVLARINTHLNIQKLQLQLQEKNEQLELGFQVVIETIPIPIIISRLSDNTIIFANKPACFLFEQPLEALLGCKILDFYDSAYHQPLQDALANQGCVSNYELQGKSGNDTPFWAVVFIQPLVFNNEQCLLSILHDMTERKKTEEVIIQTEKMLSLGGLAAGMAHEINNPLSGILQGIQNITRRISPNFKKNVQVAEECSIDLDKIHFYMEKREILNFMENIRYCGKRVSKIIDNILNFSHKSNSHFEPHDLCDLLDKTIELAASDYNLKKKYDFRKIKIIREYDTAMPTVLCDGNNIQQVFLNILRNGVQIMTESAMKKGKKPCFILRIMPDSYGMACIEIEDNGPGMEESICKQVFDPFFTTKDVGVGTGLGLSVSYFIITKNHKGKMMVKSSVGKGTKFIIQLPMDKNRSEKIY